MSKPGSTNNVIGYLSIALVTTACATLLLYFIYLQPRATHLATQNWMPTEGQILALKLVGSEPVDIRIEYRYTFRGKTYESTQYDLLKGQSGEDAWAREAYVALSKSDTTTCYVNPDDPSQAVIDRDRKHPQIAIILPIIFYGIGIVFFLLSIGEIRKKFGAAKASRAESRGLQTTTSTSAQPVGATIIGVLGAALLATIFFLAMDGIEHARSLVYRPTDWVRTDGTVDWSRSSGTRILGETVTEYQVRYNVDGTEFTDRCYAIVQPEKTVIEYDRDHPWRGRLQDTKLTSTPIVFLLFPVGLFGLLALCLAVAIVRWLSRQSISLGIAAGMASSKLLHKAGDKR